MLGAKYKWRRGLAWARIPLGIGVGIYTGVMLGAMPSRPFWNSPFPAFLFLISALSTSTALIILARAFITRGGLTEEKQEEVHESGFVLASTDTMIIGLEFISIFRLPPESGMVADHLAVALSFAADLARREATAEAKATAKPQAVPE